MSETATSDGAPKPRSSESAYVVQWQRPDDPSVWVDAVTVTVPAKTKRRTVIERAVKLAGDALDLSAAVMMRVIPAEHAEPVEVEMEQPPPQLRIGDR